MPTALRANLHSLHSENSPLLLVTRYNMRQVSQERNTEKTINRKSVNMRRKLTKKISDR